ncbi:MAG TPA: right-handed parallel beta-helix repeat-containing protein [Saprospiraceae bacterium]|nr:right-handed parallel beta-helix repeat-containing protein [Saprospiraceae bacterium]
MKLQQLYVILLFSLSLGTLYSKTYYVNSSQSNISTNGLSVSSAFAYLQTAFNVVQAGDTVLVMEGEYRSADQEAVATLRKSGKENQWIIIKNYADHRPRIIAQHSHGIILDQCNYVSIEGFDISYTSSESEDIFHCGIHITAQSEQLKSKYIKIVNNIIKGFPADGIWMNNTINYQITYNKIHSNCNQYSKFCAGIHVINGAEHFQAIQLNNEINANEIFNNKLSKSPPATVGCMGELAGQGIVVENPELVLSKLKNLENLTTRITNNLIYYNGAVGINIQNQVGVRLINNTLYKNIQYDALRCAEISIYNLLNSVIYNNIINSLPAKGGLRIDKMAQIKIKSNLYFNTSDRIEGENDLVEQPQFVRSEGDPLLFDFRLKEKSPAVNKGVNEQLPAFDFEGNLRILGNAADLGAIESPFRSGADKQLVNPNISQKTLKTFWTSSFSIAKEEFILNNHRGRDFICEMYAHDGKLLQSRVSDLGGGTSIVFDLSRYPVGFYYFKARSEKEVFQTRIQKIQ